MEVPRLPLIADRGRALVPAVVRMGPGQREWAPSPWSEDLWRAPLSSRAAWPAYAELGPTPTGLLIDVYG